MSCNVSARVKMGEGEVVVVIVVGMEVEGGTEEGGGMDGGQDTVNSWRAVRKD